jgi:hypothetical protein
VIPGPTKIIGCPHCGSLAKYGTLASSSGAGGILWTDAFFQAPMAPLPKVVGLCASCSQFFWISEAEVRGEIPSPFLPNASRPPQPAPPEWQEAHRVSALTAEQWLDALAIARERRDELLLRRHAWWKYNDQFRGPDASSGKPMSERMKQNLLALKALLDMSDPLERLQAAEIARELSDFEEAQRLAAEPPPGRYEKLGRHILELAGQHESRPAIVERPPVKQRKGPSWVTRLVRRLIRPGE